MSRRQLTCQIQLSRQREDTFLIYNKLSDFCLVFLIQILALMMELKIFLDEYTASIRSTMFINRSVQTNWPRKTEIKADEYKMKIFTIQQGDVGSMLHKRFNKARNIWRYIREVHDKQQNVAAKTSLWHSLAMTEGGVALRLASTMRKVTIGFVCLAGQTGKKMIRQIARINAFIWRFMIDKMPWEKDPRQAGEQTAIDFVKTMLVQRFCELCRQKWPRAYKCRRQALNENS